MDGFWLGVLVTVAIGIPASIVANLFTPRLSRFLEQWSRRLRERNRTKAIKTYHRLKLLRDDHLRRDMHFVRFHLVAFVSGAISIPLLLILIVVWGSTTSIEIVRKDLFLFGFLIAAEIIFLALLQKAVVLLTDDAAALGDFAAYEKKVVERFGIDAIAEEAEPAAT